MNLNTLQPMLAIAGLSFTELVLILISLLVVPLTITGIVLLVIWLLRRANAQKSPASPKAASTRRFCPQCGKEIASDAPQGLCPACLMNIALGTQGGEPPKSDSPKTPPPAPSELATRFPQLEIIELLGHGGMGAVYKARQKNLDRLVALKILPERSANDAGFTERFNREARALAKLSHPNIVGVYDYGQADGLPFFIMEFVDGLNLRQLQQAGKLAPREALQIIPQICEALQFAHDEGIVHRDIKPENVMLDKKGRVKIADFGLARILGREPTAFRLTGARDIMGTPHYMAPEQIEKPQTVDHRADIYSLGVVFYEMLTGELPLGRFAPPSQKVSVDVRLDDVVLRALEKEPERRYQTVGEVKTQVETIANQPAAIATSTHRAKGFNFKSKRKLFGLPLIHIATGTDPVTKRPEIARGFIAIGGVAQGVFAFGGVAMGGFAFGGLSLGVFAYGGLALGMMTIGGLSIGLLAACGGLAIAPIAMGGGAIGYLAQAGKAIAVHAIDAVAKDPVAERFFLPWAANWAAKLQIVNFVLLVFTMLVAFGFPLWLRARGRTRNDEFVSPPMPARGRIAPVLWIGALLAFLFVALCLVGFGVWSTWEAVKRPAERKNGLDENSVRASAEMWSPKLAPGEKPDLQKIRDAIKTFMDEGDYDAALQRQIWYFNHALEFGEVNAVRLSFGIMHWAELGRLYPKAKRALQEIRDNDARELLEGRGSPDLFSEIANLDRELGNKNATFALFKSIDSKNPQLAQRCYFYVEDMLVQHGEYISCLKYMGDPQRRFLTIQHAWQTELDSLNNRQRTAQFLETMNRQHGVTNFPVLPDTSAATKKSADDRFIGKTRQLIEILVGTGRRAEAEKIREQAVALLDSPRLESAVTDAEATVQSKAGDQAKKLERAREELTALRQRYTESHPAVQEKLKKIEDLRKELEEAQQKSVQGENR